jgi:hypothetical protein
MRRQRTSNGEMVLQEKLTRLAGSTWQDEGDRRRQRTAPRHYRRFRSRSRSRSRSPAVIFQRSERPPLPWCSSNWKRGRR